MRMILNKENILEYAVRYDREATSGDTNIETKLKRLLKEQRFLGRADLIEIGTWKSPRQKRRYEANNDATVKELTRFSFSAESEEARVGALLALNGVSYPVASAILHFAFPEQYPILDFRAIWSLGWAQPSSYNFEFWKKYYTHIRELSRDMDLPIRAIDKALWQYSKEFQKKK